MADTEQYHLLSITYGAFIFSLQEMWCFIIFSLNMRRIWFVTL